MSDRSVLSDAVPADRGAVWVGAGLDGAPDVLQVSVARGRLFELVTQARPQGGKPGVVTVVTKGRGKKEARAALVPLGCLDESARSRLSEWPSWAQTAARPKLGDLVVAAAGDPEQGVLATPQVLLDRTTPAAVLVNAALLPDDGGPVKVPVSGWRHLTLSAREVARDWAALLGEMASGEVWVEVYRSKASTSSRAALVPVVALNAEHAGLPETWPVRDEASVLGELDALVEEMTGKATAQHDAHGVVVAREGAPVAVLMDAGQAALATVRPAGRPSVAQPARARPAPGGVQGPAAGDVELRVASVAAPDEAHDAAAPGELDTVDPQPAGESAESVPGAGLAGASRRSVSALGDVLREVLALQGSDGPPTEAARFGLRALDEVVGGLLPGKLTLVAGAPGAGPSLLVAAVASDTALRRRLPVLYAASGLTRTDVAMRVIAAQAAVNYRALRTGQLTDEEQERAATVGAQLSGLAGSVWHIDDGAGLTASDIAEVARDIEGLALVVVDRLQRAHDPAVPLSGRALPAAAQALTHVARLLKVPVVAAVDTDEAELVAALDADVTLTVRRRDDRAEVDYAERDFGTLASAVLRADLACARFTDAPDSVGTTTLVKAPQATETSAPSSVTGPQNAPAGDVTVEEGEPELLARQSDPEQAGPRHVH
ncbi:AAA family ATPase (plasmid) [Streptomyces sp. NBC_01456]|uniref:DnaB-like helicase C-terminal domain-containing protein n=1 Tax=unclassified Streptomyces TaxID=2593676 RepID=UPI002E328563|nr:MULTISPECIES: DnaB-like helicase C-terminal domain-containing protein [unclassified Streptomyces]